MPLRTIRSGVTNHPEQSVLQFTTDLVRQGGVISGFEAKEKAGGANMSVDMSPGTLYAKNSTTCYPVNLDTVENVAIALNANANPLIGIILEFNDLNIQPDPDGEGCDIPHFVYIAGQPATNPVPPTGDEIKDVLGNNAPFEKLWQVKVGSQVTAITNEDLTDIRRRAYLKTPHNSLKTEALGELTLDAANADIFEVTLTGNLTLKIPNGMIIGDWIYITFYQDSNGTRTVNFSEFTPMSADMSLATGSGKVSSFAIQRGLSTYYIHAAGKQY